MFDYGECLGFKKEINDKMKQKNLIILDLLFIFLLGLVPLLWFEGDLIINGGDIALSMKPLREFWYNTLTSWDYGQGITMGSIGHDNSQFILYLIPRSFFAFTAYLTSSLQAAEKLFFIFYFILPGLTMYFMVSSLLSSSHKRIAALVASVFYMFNLYQIEVWSGVLIANLTAYITLPLMIGCIARCLKQQNNLLGYSFLIGFFSFLTSASANNPPVLVLFVGLILLYLLVNLVSLAIKRQKTKLRFTAKFIFVSILFIILFNFWWILPFARHILQRAVLGIETGFSVVQWVGGVSSEAKFFRVIRLMGSWPWYSGYGGEPLTLYAQIYLKNWFFIAFSFIIPILAFSAAIFTRKKTAYFFGFVAFVGIIFSMGTRIPFYRWLMIHLPGFWIFRTPWLKFMWLTTLGYAVLLGMAIEKIAVYLRSKKKYIFSRLVVVVFIILIIVFSYPLVLGQMFPKPSQRENLPFFHFQLPQYIYDADNWLKTQEGDFRVVQLPQQQAANYTWGYSSKQDFLQRYFEKPMTVIPYSTIGYDPVALIGNSFYDSLCFALSPHSEKILNLLSAGYLLQQNDQRYDFFDAGKSPQFIASRLKYLKGVYLDKSFGEFDFYKFKKRTPRIYAKEKLVLFSGNFDGLVPLSHTSYMDAPALIFGDYRREKNLEKFYDRTEILILYNSTLNDFIFNYFPKQYGHYVINNKADFSSHKTAQYDIMAKYKLDVKNEKPETEIVIKDGSEEVKEFSIRDIDVNQDKNGLKWIYVGTLSLRAKDYSLEITEINAKNTIEKLVIIPREEFKSYLKKAFLATGKSCNDIGYIFSVKPNVAVESKPLPITTELLEKSTFYPVIFEAKNQFWRWMSKGSVKISILNTSQSVVKTNMEFNVLCLSPKALIVYLEDKQIAAYSLIPADTSYKVVIKDIEFKPGPNELTLYTPYSPDALDKSLHDKDQMAVFFAISEKFIFGDLIWTAQRNFDIYTNKDAKYDLKIYAYPCSAEIDLPEFDVKKINLAIDGDSFALKKKSLDFYKEFNIQNGIKFLKGKHHLQFNVKGKAENYFLEILPAANKYIYKPKISYQKISQSKYLLEVITDRPINVIFNESYNSGWQAITSKGKILHHFLVNGYANGYYLPAAGACNITLEYTAKKIFSAGCIISISSFIFALLVLIIAKCRRRV